MKTEKKKATITKIRYCWFETETGRTRFYTTWVMDVSQAHQSARELTGSIGWHHWVEEVE